MRDNSPCWRAFTIRAAILIVLSTITATIAASSAGAQAIQLDIGPLARFTGSRPDAGVGAVRAGGVSVDAVLAEAAALELAVTRGVADARNPCSICSSTLTSTLYEAVVVGRYPVRRILDVTLGAGYAYEDFGRLHHLPRSAGGATTQIGLRLLTRSPFGAHAEVTALRLRGDEESNLRHWAIGSRLGITVSTGVFGVSPPGP